MGIEAQWWNVHLIVPKRFVPLIVLVIFRPSSTSFGPPLTCHPPLDPLARFLRIQYAQCFEIIGKCRCVEFGMVWSHVVSGLEAWGN